MLTILGDLIGGGEIALTRIHGNQLCIWNHCFLGMHAMNSYKEMCKWPKKTLGRILGLRNSFHRKYLGLTAGLTGGRTLYFFIALLC